MHFVVPLNPCFRDYRHAAGDVRDVLWRGLFKSLRESGSVPFRHAKNNAWIFVGHDYPESGNRPLVSSLEA
ncbi:MAG: hypothetical protein BGO99_06045 [Nitrosospira sp. 56-18]|nr:MAG: hypothetical protein BGO99_06045 [Nitrosospira sp. 56-18]